MDNLLNGHRTSFESRDINNNKFGGAINYMFLTLSFSGLPELIAEAIVFYAIVLSSPIEGAKIELIREIKREFYGKRLNQVGLEYFEILEEYDKKYGFS